MNTAALPLCKLPSVITPDDDAGFGCLRGPAGALPLRDFRADMAVVGPVWRWRLTQTFVNPAADAIEAVYIFPLPPRAAVTAFRLRVAGRIVIGSLKERGAARAAYQEAVSQGKRAALLEEDRPNVFTIQVGNIQPGESAEVEIELSGAVAVENGVASVRLPLVVAPRYIPGSAIGDDVGQGTAGDTDAVPDASRISPPVLLPGFHNPVRLAIGIAIDGIDATDLSCSLPTVADGAGRWRVVPGQRLDRDCILRWSARGEQLAARALLAPGAVDGGCTLAVSIMPPESAARASKPRDVVILLDRSGSMEGWKMVAARRAAARLVDALDARDRFAALAFDNVVEGHDGSKPVLHAATDRVRFAATTWLGQLDARGGTEMNGALERAFALLAHDDASRERILVLVTDAQIGDEARLLKNHAKNLKRTRVVALGVDQAVNEALLERLVAPNGGWHACVESEDWLDQVLALAARAVQPPVLSDIVVETEAGALPALTPDPVSDAWSSRPLTLWSRLPTKPRSVIVRGTLANGEPWRSEVAIEQVDEAAIHAAWARGRIRDLEDRYAVSADGDVAATMTQLSLAEGVLSRFTAFVAIDQVVTESTGTPRTVVQPVESPAGWAADAPDSDCEGKLEMMSAPPACAPAPTGGFGGSQAFAISACEEVECAEVAPASPKKRSLSVSRSRRVAEPAQSTPPAGDPVSLATALRDRLALVAGDSMRLALALRAQRTTAELHTLLSVLRTHGATELVERLQAICARIATPTTMPAVAAMWPDLDAVLVAIGKLESGQKSPRRSWWR